MIFYVEYGEDGEPVGTMRIPDNPKVRIVAEASGYVEVDRSEFVRCDDLVNIKAGWVHRPIEPEK